MAKRMPPRHRVKPDKLNLFPAQDFGGGMSDDPSSPPDVGRWKLCPFSGTMQATDLATDTAWIFADGCRRWDCPACGPAKKSALIRRICDAQPSRFITLTCRHVDSPEAQLQTMRRALPRLATKVRKLIGEFEYLRMLEECRDGYPHFHLLARSKFVKQNELKTNWEKLTGAPVVDIRKAYGKSVKYVAKYLGKAATADGRWQRQRVSVSQHFWLPQHKDAPDFADFRHTRMHPQSWFQNFAPAKCVERNRYAAYVVVDREPGDQLPNELLPIDIERDCDWTQHNTS